MTVQETAEKQQATLRMPMVSPISWVATIPQLVALTTTVSMGWLITRSSLGVFMGGAVYLTYSIGSRQLILSAHWRGVRLMQSHRFEEAILAFSESYEFFTRHAWLDRYRSLTMMSPAAVSFREMALINIAVAYSQNVQGDMAKTYYQKALEEFPNSEMAAVALKMIESIENTSTNHPEAT